MDIIRKPKLRKSDDGESTIGEDPFSLDDKYKLYFSPFAHNHDVEFGYFEEDQLPLIFEKVFFFSLIWSFGASLGKDGRTTFDAFIKDIAEKQEAKSHFPSQLTVFDYYIDLQKISWLPWCDSSTSSPILVDKPIEQQLVPTNESASMMFLARLMVSHSHHVLFHGPESSKSLVIKMLMENILDSKKFDCRYLPLANCSTSSNLVKILRSFMQRRHGTYGPLPGKDLLVFLDNLGSVKPDFYGSQPPLELIRQYFDYGGWYDTSKVEFQTIVNTIVISAMAPQGGGFYGIPERLLRHYFYIHIPKLSNKSMSIIISSLLTHQLSHHSQPVKDLITPTTNALINIFDRCTQVLLPIPSKLHYVFSLRNMVRVIKGIMLAAPNDVNDDKSFIKLWYHELMKEFHDRFNSDNDRNWFIKALQDIMDKHFKIKFDELCPANTLLFNGFFDHSMAYKECTLSSDQLLNVCRDVLIDHNREASKPLDIVLFNEAVDHISSISRVLSMPRGHLMLVGVKSSGRKSLARLSMHISSMESFEIQITRTYGINPIGNYMMTKFFPSWVFKDIRFPEGHVFEDAFISMKLFNKIEKYIILPETEYYYVFRNNSIVNTPKKDNLFDAILARIEQENDLSYNKQLQIQAYILTVYVAIDTFRFFVKGAYDLNNNEKYILKNIVAARKKYITFKDWKLSIKIFLFLNFELFLKLIYKLK